MSGSSLVNSELDFTNGHSLSDHCMNHCLTPCTRSLFCSETEQVIQASGLIRDPAHVLSDCGETPKTADDFHYVTSVPLCYLSGIFKYT